MAQIVIFDEHYQPTFDKNTPPVARAHSGDTVVFHCRDCYNRTMHADRMAREDMHISCANPATGPLYIEEAKAGDVLKVEILEIQPDVRGCMRVRPGSGTYEIDQSLCRVFSIDPKAMTVDFEGITIPLRPMIGVIGTAPAGDPVDTETPGDHGGNLDIREMTAGSTVYLPVGVDGALLSLGDLHGLQGDGETVICGLEMNGTVTVRVSVLKNRQDIPTPLLVTPTHYITTAAHPSLDVCSVEAARRMHHFLISHTTLDNPHAGMLLSLKGDLRISQIVNPAKGCMMAFPKGVLPIDFE